MKHCWVKQILLSAALLLPLPLVAAPLQIGIMDFPPFYTVNGQTLGGPLLETMEQITAKAGFAYEANGYPSRRLYKLLAESRVNLFVGIKEVDTYREKVWFSSVPISSLELRVYAKKPLDDFTGIEELRGKRVATIAGYGYGGIRDNFLDDPANDITVIDTFSHQSAIAVLNAGRADLLLHYAGPTDSYLKQHRITGLQHQLINHLELFLIVSKNTPDSEQVLSALEQAYHELQSEGVLALSN